MAPEDRPNLGFKQPKTGTATALGFQSMGRRSKEYRLPARIQHDIADNLNGLIAASKEFIAMPDDTSRNKKLAKTVETSLSHVQRIRKGTGAIGVDLLERLARALNTTPAYLVTPYAGAEGAPKTASTVPVGPTPGMVDDTKDGLHRHRSPRGPGTGNDTT